MKRRRPTRSFWLDAFSYACGCAVYAVGVTVFVSPARLVPGGVTGLSLIAEVLWGLPVGTVTLLLNLPLLWAAYRWLGRAFTVRTVIGTVLSSVFIDLAAALLPAYEGERMLAALFGGVCIGAGLGILYMRGATAGGTEIIARLLERRFPHVPIGQLLLAVDVLVIALGAAVLQDIDAVLYAVLLVAVSSLLLDRVLAGMDAGALLLIQTTRPDEVTRAVFERLDRGVTRLEAVGGYSGQRRPLLLCAVRRTQYHPLSRLVAAIDPEAFVIVLPTDWVYGNGFRALPAPRQS